MPFRGRLSDRLDSRAGQPVSEDMRGRELLLNLLTNVMSWSCAAAAADRLIEEFDDFAGVVSADFHQLCQVPYLTVRQSRLLKAIHEAALHLTMVRLEAAPVLDQSKLVMDYLNARLGHCEVEEFHALFLDAQHRLIASEHLATGAVTEVPVVPAQVLRRALLLNAAGIVLVHNHPSGHAAPSDSDIQRTYEIQALAADMGVVLHDHIIIARGGHASMRQLGLLLPPGSSRFPWRTGGQ